MGTSLLGFEMKAGKVFYQYMQFEGVPSVKGREYYNCITAMTEAPNYFINKTSGKPTSRFFLRLRHFLYEYQYGTAHSFNNQHETKRALWDAPLSYKKGLDHRQEWQYLFTIDGDYVFYPTNENLDFKVVIPWSFTKALIENVPEIRSSKYNNTGFFGRFWSSLNNMWERIENRKVIRWNKEEAPLHIGDKFHFDSSKEILEQVLRGEKVKIASYPQLSLELGEQYVFPEQKDKGWRDFARITFNGKPVVVSLFGTKKKLVRNLRTEQILITKKDGKPL